MKRYLLITCLLFCFFGCDDFLNQSNPNTLTPDTFWNTEADAQSAIIGTYSPLSTINYHGRLWSGYVQVRSDAVRSRGDFSHQSSLFNTNPADGNFTNSWAEFWKVIFRANQVLKNVPEIEMDEDLKKYILGEAYFLRAYNYFMLVNYFLNVPLVTEPAGSLAETQQPQVAPELVWDQIIEDLRMAVDLLPNSWDDKNLGRVTAGAAAALLGKSHLYQEEWSDAARELKRVIDKEFGLYILMPNYEDNFRESTENNAESLFEIQYDLTGAWTAGWGADVPSTARFNSYGFDIARGGASYINEWVWDLFMREQNNDGEIDLRAYETMVWDYPGAEWFGGNAFADEWAGQINDTVTFVKSAKYVEPNSGAPAPAFNSFAANKRIIRFADVLLMYAEAENEDNGPANAYEAINRVRARANMPDIPAGLSQADFRQRVRDERVLELTLESHRQLDLLRWGMLPDRITDNPEFRSGNVFYVEGREYLPIPQLEINTNPKMVQNKGYL